VLCGVTVLVSLALIKYALSILPVADGVSLGTIIAQVHIGTLIWRLVQKHHGGSSAPPASRAWHLEFATGLALRLPDPTVSTFSQPGRN